jgi:hypothetical protein
VIAKRASKLAGGEEERGRRDGLGVCHAWDRLILWLAWTAQTEL